GAGRDVDRLLQGVIDCHFSGFPLRQCFLHERARDTHAVQNVDHRQGDQCLFDCLFHGAAFTAAGPKPSWAA
ncbi:hypothetical protein ABTQ09_20490, partial [Acinetobacter baumannii]